jgi:hypothetical protein
MVTLLFSCLPLLLAFALVIPVVCGSLIYVLLSPCGGGLVSGQPSRKMMAGRTPPLTPHAVGFSRRLLAAFSSLRITCISHGVYGMPLFYHIPTLFRQHPSGYGLRVRQSIYPAEAGYGQPSS